MLATLASIALAAALALATAGTSDPPPNTIGVSDPPPNTRASIDPPPNTIGSIDPPLIPETKCSVNLEYCH